MELFHKQKILGSYLIWSKQQLSLATKNSNGRQDTQF